MAKLINEPVKVHGQEALSLKAFVWRRRFYRVREVINWWRQPASWDRSETPLFLRVNATSGYTLAGSTGTYELCRLGEEWFLHRVID
jgi:hypothetical protein